MFSAYHAPKIGTENEEEEEEEDEEDEEDDDAVVDDLDSDEESGKYHVIYLFI